MVVGTGAQEGSLMQLVPKRRLEDGYCSPLLGSGDLLCLLVPYDRRWQRDQLLGK